MELKQKLNLVHCWDGTKDDGWFPWLDKKISNSNNKVIRFNMPNTANPKIEDWVTELDKQVKDLYPIRLDLLFLVLKSVKKK